MTIMKARRALTVVWLAGAGVTFATLLVQTLSGRYGIRADEAWSWFLPSVLPTIGVMIAVVFKTTPDRRHVSRFTFRLCVTVSLVYVALVAGTVFLQPFSVWSAFQLFKMSHLWLAPTQALADGVIGYLFLSGE